MPEAEGKLCYVIIIQDRHTKYALADLIPNWEPETVVEQLLVSWVRDLGFPRSICSELGNIFEEQVWRALCDWSKVYRPHIPYPILALTEKFHRYIRE